jgi:hypothetical protein
MKSLIRLVLFEIVFFMLGILGALAMLAVNDTNLTWHSLGTPPDKAIRIVEGNSSAVRVQTSIGDTYYCQFRPLGKCWVHSNQPVYSHTTPLLLGKKYGDPPPMPAGIIDAKKFYTQENDYAFVLSVFAITQQGEVYVWQSGFGTPYDGLIFYCLIPIAVISGFVLWLVLEQSQIWSPRWKASF